MYHMDNTSQYAPSKILSCNKIDLSAIGTVIMTRNNIQMYQTLSINLCLTHIT